MSALAGLVRSFAGLLTPDPRNAVWPARCLIAPDALW
jgi:hypothetical protein